MVWKGIRRPEGETEGRNQCMCALGEVEACGKKLSVWTQSLYKALIVTIKRGEKCFRWIQTAGVTSNVWKNTSNFIICIANNISATRPLCKIQQDNRTIVSKDCTETSNAYFAPVSAQVTNLSQYAVFWTVLWDHTDLDAKCDGGEGEI